MKNSYINSNVLVIMAKQKENWQNILVMNWAEYP